MNAKRILMSFVDISRGGKGKSKLTSLKVKAVLSQS